MNKTHALILGTIFTKLADERYTLRSVANIVAALPSNLGIDAGQVQNVLDEHSDVFHTKARRSDGATLVGLDEEYSRDEATVLGAVLTAVSETQYKFRTLSGIAKKLDASEGDVENVLDSSYFGQNLEWRRRRSDGATLVGLA